MARLVPLICFVLAGFAAARQCSNFSIPVDIAARQGVFEEISVSSNLDVSAFATRFNAFQTNYSATLLQDYQTLQGTYNISAQYCRPDNGSSGVIQVLSHGIGFDKTYWDLSYNDYNYSYVNIALGNGYSTLAIDRLGIGLSSHGDPLNEIQAQAEVEALNAVTSKLRHGEIPDIDSAYGKVIHVGHSFGSVQSYWLSAMYPENTDGVVLTGYSAIGAFMPYIVAGWDLHSARLNQPLRLGNASNDGQRRFATHAQYNLSQNLVTQVKRFLNGLGVGLTSQEVWDVITSTELLDLVSDSNETVVQLNYPSGYFASSDLTALQYAFFFPGNYDVGIALAAEYTKQPVTTGELLTIGNAPKKSPFTGPVFVISGQHDVPFCGGNCLGQVPDIAAPNIPASAQMQYPSASTFEAYIQPNTGHGINLHYNATAAYQVIQDFLARNGLAAQ